MELKHYTRYCTRRIHTRAYKYEYPQEGRLLREGKLNRVAPIMPFFTETDAGQEDRLRREIAEVASEIVDSKRRVEKA